MTILKMEMAEVLLVLLSHSIFVWEDQNQILTLEKDEQVEHLLMLV